MKDRKRVEHTIASCNAFAAADVPSTSLSTLTVTGDKATGIGVSWGEVTTCGALPPLDVLGVLDSDMFVRGGLWGLHFNKIFRVHRTHEDSFEFVGMNGGRS
jgi:hypothetical protein